MGFLAEAAALYRAERRLKHGDMEPDEFEALHASMGRSQEAFRFFRATVLVVLHVPVIEVPYLLGLGLAVPVLAAWLLAGADGLLLVFWVYVGVRGLVGLQDAAIMTWAHRSGYIPFNSSLTGTVLGSLPYPYAYAVGPLVWTVVEVGLYGVVVSLPGLFVEVEQVFPGLLAGISTVGVLQILWHTLVRAAANGVIAWEMPRLADPDTFHRVRSWWWRWKNRLLGRGHDEVEEAEAVWSELRGDLKDPRWQGLDEELEHLGAGPRKRVKRYLLASRKDEMILRTLLGS